MLGACAHTPVMGFSAGESYHLFRGPQRYLNWHSGPLTKINGDFGVKHWPAG